MENPGLTISPSEVLNTAILLPTPEGSVPFHSCLETLDHWTKPQEGLSEDPLTNPEEIWYTDGSSFVLDGKRRARYAVVSTFETIEAKPLPPGWIEGFPHPDWEGWGGGKKNCCMKSFQDLVCPGHYKVTMGHHLLLRSSKGSLKHWALLISIVPGGLSLQEKQGEPTNS